MQEISEAQTNGTPGASKGERTPERPGAGDASLADFVIGHGENKRRRLPGTGVSSDRSLPQCNNGLEKALHL